MLENELENEELEEQDTPFQVLEDESEKICDNCALLRTTRDGVSYVCGTYKARNTHQNRINGKDIKTYFYCYDYADKPEI